MLGNIFSDSDSDSSTDEKNRANVPANQLTTSLTKGDANYLPDPMFSEVDQISPKLRQNSGLVLAQTQARLDNPANSNNNGDDPQEPPEVDEKSQIRLDLDTPRTTRLRRATSDIRRWENIVEVMPFWRLPVNSINVTFSAVTAVAIAVLILFNIGVLSQIGTVPFFYSQSTAERIELEPAFIAIVPIVVVAIELILLRFKRIIFNFDRRLATVLGTSQTFFNFIMIIGVVQLLSLLLV